MGLEEGEGVCVLGGQIGPWQDAGLVLNSLQFTPALPGTVQTSEVLVHLAAMLGSEE